MFYAEAVRYAAMFSTTVYDIVLYCPLEDHKRTAVCETKTALTECHYKQLGLYC